MLNLHNIDKTYKNVIALKDVSLTFQPGIYGLIGPNGAGKSTLLNIIASVLKPTQGKVYFEKQNIELLKSEYRKVLGLMPQTQSGYGDFSGYAFLFYMAALKNLGQKEGSQQINHLIQQVSLEDVIHRKIKTYSGGMRQRLMFAQTLLGNPKIVILDEPTAGLDPFERIKMRNYISEVSKDKIVIIATHVMQDIEAIVDQIILIKDGYIIKMASPQELMRKVNGFVYEKKIDLHKLQYYSENYLVSQVIKREDDVIIRYIDKNIKNEKYSVFANLDEVYLYYMV